MGVDGKEAPKVALINTATSTSKIMHPPEDISLVSLKIRYLAREVNVFARYHRFIPFKLCEMPCGCRNFADRHTAIISKQDLAILPVDCKALW